MEEKTTGAWGRVNNIPVNQKFLISIREASDYFGIGIKNMRRLAEMNTDRFAVLHGNRYMIIRHRFEEYIEECLGNEGGLR